MARAAFPILYDFLDPGRCGDAQRKCVGLLKSDQGFLRFVCVTKRQKYVEGQLRNLVDGDFDGLEQAACVAGEDQDLIVLGHHGVPVARLSEGGGGGAARQGDRIGQGCGTLIVADDNQRHDEYDPPDHSCGQDRHQSPQETQVGWFGDLILRGVVHV